MGWQERSRYYVGRIGEAKSLYQDRYGQMPSHVGVPVGWRQDLVNATQIHGLAIVWLHDRCQVIVWRQAEPYGGRAETASFTNPAPPEDMEIGGGARTP